MSYVTPKELKKGDVILLDDKPVYVDDILYRRIGAERILRGQELRPKDIKSFTYFSIHSETTPTEQQNTHALTESDTQNIEGLDLQNPYIIVDSLIHQRTHAVQKDFTAKHLGRLTPVSIAEIGKLLNPKIETPTKNGRVRRPEVTTIVTDISLENAEKMGYISRRAVTALKKIGLNYLREAFDEVCSVETPPEMTIHGVATSLEKVKPGKLEDHPAFSAAKKIEVDSPEAENHLPKPALDILRTEKRRGIDDGESESFPISEVFETALQTDGFKFFIRPKYTDLFLTNGQITALKRNIDRAFNTLTIQNIIGKELELGNQKFLQQYVDGAPKLQQHLIKRTL